MTPFHRTPYVSFVGDDFTGSSAVMELMAFAGLPSVLFLDVPTQAQLAPYRHHAAIGIATIARAQNPQWMAQHLPKAFTLLAELGAPVAHYKVCSTFDSSPQLGSIGAAIDLALPLLGGRWHPLLTAAPEIGRYQLFGNLFAQAGDQGYRLDRHPAMSCHPATPMDEADITRHLARQTNTPITLIDFPTLSKGHAHVPDGGGIVAIDVIDENSLIAAGRLIWENRGEHLFAIGSQGIEYALLAYWRHRGWIMDKPPSVNAGPQRIAAVSGSCSPVTARQIDWAAQNGMKAFKLDVRQAFDGESWKMACGHAVEQANAALSADCNPLIYTALGPDDPTISELQDRLAGQTRLAGEVHSRIGQGLGAILKSLIQQNQLRRAAIAGGDSSGHALRELGIVSLEAIAELAPACAISRAQSHDGGLDGIEIALKGGQMGPTDYFGRVMAGHNSMMKDQTE